MPISEDFVLRYLLQETTRPRGLRWVAQDDGAYRTRVNGVLLRLWEAENSMGKRIALDFEYGGEGIQILEAPSAGLLKKRFRSIEEEQIAASLEELAAAVRRSCAELLCQPDRDQRQQSIFRRMLLAELARE